MEWVTWPLLTVCKLDHYQVLPKKAIFNKQAAETRLHERFFTRAMVARDLKETLYCVIRHSNRHTDTHRAKKESSLVAPKLGIDPKPSPADCREQF
jgi:hypothetical protein